MRGNVTADGREAILTVEVFPPTTGEEPPTLRVEAVVDTGFTGELTLRPSAVESLSLPVVGSAESVLADGNVVLEDVCVARVLWHGRERPVRATVADTAPLIGMSLLGGSELRVRAEGGGEVVIEELPSSRSPAQRASG